ncbi:hypothetical protein EFE32_03930 [Lactococcus lactis subsp. lactis]|uniref:hypothetical protein n=1 Tax=Lactococcus lactis TaxID=1358 RepID=UPI00223BD83B|nr:hypothetical protein [Lactococcus lactis]MCT0016017.1 hypothetical protein [Lactococcus lactis subsp. lactis]
MEHPIFTTIELKGTLYLYSVDEEARRKGFTKGYKVADLTMSPNNLEIYVLFLGLLDNIPKTVMEACERTTVEAIFSV